MKIEKKLAPERLYKEYRTTDNIKYIVVQVIENNIVQHYHVHNGKAIQLIPDNYMSDSVKGAKLSDYGKLHGICNKYNSISVGVPNNMSAADKQTCVNLLMTIKQRYKICNENIVRQLDVTGVANPEQWHDNDKWNADIKNKLIDI